MREEDKDIRERIITNSFWNLSRLIINRIGALIFTIILARFLVPEGYGLYSLVLSTSMIFFTFADLGINMTLVRYLSLALKKDKRKIPSYHRYLLKFKFLLSLIVSIIFIFLSYPLAFYVFKNSQLFLPFLVASFYIFILSFDTFYTQVFYSIEKVQYVSLKESINHILRIVFALFIFYFIASYYYIVGIFLSFIIISFFMILFSLFYIKKLIPEFYLKPKIEVDKRKIRRFVGFVTIASISSVFFSYVDSIMLGVFLSLEYVGYYRAAFSLVFGIVGILSFTNIVLLTSFTKLKDEKNKIFEKIIKYILIIIVPSVFGLLILGRYFIRIFFGYSYLPATLPLYFLAPLIFPIVLIGIFLSLFSAKEKPEIFAKLILIISIINVVLNLIFIKLFLLISPLWATAGAAIATLISWTIYFVASIYAIKKEFNFLIPFKPLIKPLIASLIMSGILLYTSTLIDDMNLVLGIGVILFGIFIYFSIMFLIGGIKKKDLNLLRVLIKK